MRNMNSIEAPTAKQVIQKPHITDKYFFHDLHDDLRKPIYPYNRRNIFDRLQQLQSDGPFIRALGQRIYTSENPQKNPATYFVSIRNINDDTTRTLYQLTDLEAYRLLLQKAEDTLKELQKKPNTKLYIRGFVSEPQEYFLKRSSHKLEVGGMRIENLILDLRVRGVTISDHAEYMTRSKDFPSFQGPKTITLVEPTINDFGRTDPAIRLLYAIAHKNKLIECSPDVPFYMLREAISSPSGENLDHYNKIIGMKPISSFDGSPRVFVIENHNGFLSLNTIHAEPYDRWNINHQIVFRPPGYRQ